MLEYLLGGIWMSIATIFAIKDTYKENLEIKNIKVIIIVFTYAIMLGMNYRFTTDVLRFIMITVLTVIVNKILFNKEMKNTIISVIAVEIIALISEIIFGIIVLSFTTLTSSEMIIDKYFGSLIANSVISIMIIVMTMFKMPFKVYQKLMFKTEKIKDKQIFLMTFLLIITVNILFSSIYYDMPLIILMILNTIIMIAYGYIILKITNEKNENLKIFEKYKKTADSLNEYHDIVNKYRVNNHESRNQLQTIERMARTSGDKDIEKYVQTLLEKNDQTKSKIKLEKIVIPDGWLKTTIYTKLETIIENKIKYTLDIDRTVKTSDLIEIDEHTMLDICNILNIFLDNAIEAVNEYEKSKIKIRLYKENNMIVISVSNPCYKNLEINKIGTKGYTSKGEGRGYGLAFVKETIKNNKKLINEKRVSDGVFIQILKIKINK